MKSLLTSILALTLTTACFTGCSSDDPMPEPVDGSEVSDTDYSSEMEGSSTKSYGSTTE